MLQIIEHTPTRLVLRDQQRTAGLIAAVFTGLSVISVIATAYQGVDLLILRADRDMLAVRLSGLALFLAFGLGFVFLGMAAYQHFTKGVTLILDKSAEIMHLETVRVLRVAVREHSIYGISRVDVLTDPRMRVHALHVVLRTGEKIPVATVAAVDGDAMERAVTAIRAFLP
ncbi:MAG: hypothetical protein OHK0046_20630 [Anaerolineae bacterium]